MQKTLTRPLVEKLLSKREWLLWPCWGLEGSAWGTVMVARPSVGYSMTFRVSAEKGPGKNFSGPFQPLPASAH